ncbi:hypothetical protein AXG93_3415s1010 [Marchantia polymorpha subsp. ruderalis]|uniref:Reverse transcriptase Ty1/copia-type domain-containing protein n=1 Tax=Marchantia polymorpha subsp. ruderalis TaxID=1480154 RepID=A0A176WG15_MARPO|nr:hypothetical protein AXG93_3415s1010 [Marchantia polymorpha subsp. ruderalis]
MHLRDALYSLKKRLGDTMSQHITKFCLLLNQLAAIGRTIPEEEAYICLLRILPPEYSSFVHSMRTLHVSSTQSLNASILHEESHLQEEELANGMAALYTAPKHGWTSTPNIANGRHSGATQHMAYNKNDFMSYTELPSEEFEYLGDDSRQPIQVSDTEEQNTIPVNSVSDAGEQNTYQWHLKLDHMSLQKILQMKQHHMYTIPDILEQNGVAENRTLIDVVVAMLSHSGLPHGYWGEAIHTTVYLQNRSPSKALLNDKTTHELWHGHKPDLHHLQVFGCTAFAHIEKGHREMFSHVVNMTSMRVLMALAAQHNLELHHMDVKTAFLNGRLDEEVYMALPEGLNIPSKKNMVSLYVDDCVLVSDSLRLFTKIKEKLETEFKMVDLEEIHHCLGMQVDRNCEEGWIRIFQPRYLVEKLARFNMTDSKPIDTPMEPGLKLSVLDSPKSMGESEEMKDVSYQAVVGSLMWAMVCTRPYISFAVNDVAQFMSNLGLTHWKVVKRIFRYLKGTLDFGLVGLTSNPV